MLMEGEDVCGVGMVGGGWRVHPLAWSPASAGRAAGPRAAKRAEPGLRMELMNPLDYTYVGENLKSRRIHFLSAFLDDTTPRVIPGGEDEGKFSGPCAGFTFPCLRVCDLAAMKLASVLDWKDAPDENWTEAQWNDLRRRCRQAGAGQ